MPVDLRKIVFISHPNRVFLLTVFVLATLSFSPQPSFLPIVLCLAVIQTFSRIVIPRPNAVYRFVLLWIALSGGVALAHLIPSLEALSTPSTSVAVLTSFSALSSLLALLAVFTDAHISGRGLTPWAETVLFPTIWTTFWYAYSSASPVGRLVGWSPLRGAEGYKWVSSWAGPVGLDWVVASWAVLGYRAVGAWFIGPEEETENGQLLDHPLQRPSSQSGYFTRTRSFFTLAAILTFLAAPSIFRDDIPLPTFSPDVTPLTVACVLPAPRNAPLSLSDFMAETKRLNRADVLLWPEGAVKFANQTERDDVLEQVGRALPGHHIGVGFEEPDPDSHHMQPRGRTGLAVVHWNGLINTTTEVKMLYYKRHLVPIAESFSLNPSYDPPTIYTIDLHAHKGIRKPDWAPAPNYTRPIPITGSICLDFSHPSQFSALESRPALILGPARTWHTSIGVAMWEQAKARAEEIGSMVLWCDGGKGGVSGIGGMGINEITRVGAGSWTRTVAVQWPFWDQQRTGYARGGDVWALLAFWALAAGGLGGKHWEKGLAFVRFLPGALGGIGRAIKARVMPTSQPQTREETQPLLVDV